MKTKAILFLWLALLVSGLTSSLAQGTAFTYQGRLNDGANPAGGIYDLRFAIYDSSGGGVQQGPTLTNLPTGVTNGLFTVTLDFGAGIFTGADRWLAISVRTNGGGAFAALNPRQKITPTPYAITSGNLSGALAAGQLSGNLNAAVLPTGGNWALSSTLTLDATTLAVDPVNNRVGIGTSTPATPLTVATGIGVSYGIEHTDGTRRLSTYLDDSGCWLGSVSADKLSFYVNNGGSALTIDLAGRVGIGTASPTHQLTVVSAETNALRVMTPATGDNTVILPTGSISSLESGDEAGLAHARKPGFPGVFLNTFWTPTITNSINCPGPGFVIAIFSATASASGGAITLEIGPTSLENPGNGYGHNDYGVATIHRVFSVAGMGTYSYRVMGIREGSLGSVSHQHLTLLYVPTAYGSVDP